MMKDETLSSKQMLYDLHSMSAFATKICGKGKSYASLLFYIVALSKESSTEPFRLKTIAKAIGWNISKVRKELEKLYTDLTNQLQEPDIPIQFPKPEVTFFLKVHDKYQCLTVNIEVIPRVGENVYIPFFKAKLKHTEFYVERVDHDFTDTKHLISIRLMVGYANQHLLYKKDQAYAEGRISLDEYFRLDSYDTKQMVQERTI